jgi:hypothetical protein
LGASTTGGDAWATAGGLKVGGGGDSSIIVVCGWQPADKRRHKTADTTQQGSRPAERKRLKYISGEIFAIPGLMGKTLIGPLAAFATGNTVVAEKSGDFQWPDAAGSQAILFIQTVLKC